MKIEIRADGTHICGYVNVPDKKSLPLPLPKYGMVIETVEPKAFEKAINRAENIRLTVDHGSNTYASTADGTLKLFEDGIGLYTDAIISDSELINAAKQKKIVVGVLDLFRLLKKLKIKRTVHIPCGAFLIWSSSMFR